MKKLICADDIKSAAEKGQKSFYVEGGTIVTPSARDLAKELGVELACAAAAAGNQGCQLSDPQKTGQRATEFNRDMIYQTIKMVLTNHLLTGAVAPAAQPPFMAEGEPQSGLKIVRGRTVNYVDFDTGKPGANAAYREVVDQDESQMSAGFLTIEKSSFDRKLNCEEIQIVLEGSLAVTINGKTFEACQGDVLHVPKGSQVTWSSSGYVKIFCVTYPANRA
ncbi:cupin domain-containing protein [Desulfitobacterium sp. PCE1]|uniref:cupin domain-containing protein n=1 Tax=Desulfitobacterium sp. PCE1 TaxID=146907 RepID=UPI00036703EE|nr:cupin domain-containing protein [Desulfitobacterium sp. PCE1]